MGSHETFSRMFPATFEPLEPRLMLDAALPTDEPVIDDGGTFTFTTSIVKNVQEGPAAQGATTNIPVDELLPLSSGNAWNYAGVDSYGAMTRALSVVGTQIVGATTTFEVEKRDTSLAGTDLDNWFLTNDASGLRLHRIERIQDLFHPVFFLSETETYGPISMLPTTIDVGDVINFAGGLSGFSAGNFWSGTFGGNFTVVGRETIIVAAGTFDTVVLTMDAIYSRLETGGIQETHTTSATYWLSENVGIISESSDVIVNRTGETPFIYSVDLDLTTYGVTPVAVAEYVTRLYQGILRRLPDTGGFQSWVNAIVGGVSQAQAARSFVTSAEYELYVAPVTRMYRAFLGRSPDLAGLTVWKSVARTSGMGAVALGFANSAEFITRNGNIFTNPDLPTFVRFLYVKVLGRIPAEAPANNEVWPWVQRLQLGLPRQSLMVFFTESTEYINPNYLAVHAINLGLGLLNRAPAAGAELNTWVATAAGGGFTAVAQMILNSPEYAALAGLSAPNSGTPVMLIESSVPEVTTMTVGAPALFVDEDLLAPVL